MRKILPALLGAIIIGSPTVSADETAHWSHTGDTGPAHWADLSEAFKLCGTGKNQSPVNLTDTFEVDLEEISFTYQSAPLSVTNNKHSIAVDYPKGSRIVVDKNTYELGHFHFHSPSEHQIEGQSYPLEAHLVHKSAQDEYTVIGVMFTEGEANPLLEKVWKYMPTEEGKKDAPKEITINVMELLPENKDYYRYNGSLTTPPCSEGLRWIVMKQPLTASAEQIKQFKAVMHHDNSRPLQPINARILLK